MRKVYKWLAMLLAVISVVSICALPAAAYSYPMEVTITYKTTDGTTLGTKTFSVDAAATTREAVSVPSPSYDGYSLQKSSDTTVTGSMISWSFPMSNYIRHGTGSYTVYYVKNASVTIYYLYGSSHRTAATSKTVSGAPSATYIVYSPSVTGYTPNQTSVYDTYGNGNKYVYYYINTYTLSFDANGGTGAPSSITYNYGQSVGIPSTYPRKTGYDFLGWSASKYASSPSYSVNDQYTANVSRTLYAVWQIRTYTLRYDANGGTGAPASQTKIYGRSIYIPYTTPTRSGYTFAGWGYVSTATGAAYEPGEEYSTNYSRTLYAIWQKNAVPATYTVSYNANGGSGAPSSQTKTQNVTLTLSSTKPTRSGYTFKGWSESSTATSATYSVGGSYTKNASATLYAVWEQNYVPPVTYTVSYNANGGSGAPSSQTKTQNVALTLSNVTPTRSGYSFLGWSASSTATSPTYYAGSSYTNNASVTLYAVWSKITPATYTVSYNANGGSGAPSSQTKTQNVTLTLSSTKPIRSGYTFLGWSTVSSATSPSYYAGGSYTSNASATLYAVWQKNPTAPATYTIVYNANGGTGAPSSQTKTQNVALTLSGTEPTRSRYAFIGWATYSTATSASYQPGGSYTANAGVTLYAVWQYVPATFSVSYNANGGSGAPSSQVKTENIDLQLSGSSPYRSGYTFDGWGTSSAAIAAVYVPSEYYTANASITLYAVWTKIPPTTYTISYNANGGSGAPGNQTKTHDVTLTISSSKPYREGHTFFGWSTDSGATDASYASGGSYTANSSVTLYAVWKTDTYTVSYNANGGSGAPASQTKTYGMPLTLSSIAPGKDNCVFLGWAETSNATSAAYRSGDSYTEDESIMLYAVWQERNYDFSVSNLTVTPNEIEQYGNVTVSFRLDSWDRSLPYSDIPVEVLLNGSCIYWTSVDFTAYGVQNISFNLNVGATEGTQTLAARVNWSEHNSETRTANNEVSATFTVNKVLETSTSAVSVNGAYIEGNEVISSFYATNDGSFDILPKDGISYDFIVYTLENGSVKIISRQTWSDVVIPANGTNLVYFKWTVPENSAGTTYFCKGTINSTKADSEQNKDNNSVEFSIVAQDYASSQTPNTRYERTAPSGYSAGVAAPTVKSGTAAWNMWVYENNTLVLKTYGISVTNTNPTVTPSSGCTTAEKVGSSWKMKSGYGITLSWNPTLTVKSGCTMPGSDAYTSAQSVYATFPEFSYSMANGKYRTLESVGGSYQFVANADADKSERVHFIPVYVQNGSYTVSVTATQIWTPAGMITATRSANAMNINGTVYDDWYQG